MSTGPGRARQGTTPELRRTSDTGYTSSLSQANILSSSALLTVAAIFAVPFCCSTSFAHTRTRKWFERLWEQAQYRTPKNVDSCSSTATTTGFVAKFAGCNLAPPVLASDEFETVKYCQIYYDNLPFSLIQPSLTSNSTLSLLSTIMLKKYKENNFWVQTHLYIKKKFTFQTHRCLPRIMGSQWFWVSLSLRVPCDLTWFC